jgi:hypothetical protein
MNADSLKLKGDGALRQHRCVGRAFRFLMARPCPALKGTGNNVGVPGVSDVLFRQATASVTLMSMCTHIRLYRAHHPVTRRDEHFRRDYALVYTRMLNRAASRRPMVWPLSVEITLRRLALIPIVPYDNGVARVGLSPFTYARRSGEYPLR